MCRPRCRSRLCVDDLWTACEECGRRIPRFGPVLCSECRQEKWFESQLPLADEIPEQEPPQ